MRIRPLIRPLQFRFGPVAGCIPGTVSRANLSTTIDPALAQSTINQDEIAHFSKLSALWWDERGEFQMLHRMNPVRMKFIREKMMALEDDLDALVTEAEVLQGRAVLDVGCGGGLLSESLARMGAKTLGIDASSSNISIASLHASADPFLDSSSSKQGKRKGSLTYKHTSVEDLLAEYGPASFDVVCSMEVLEHVDNPRGFLHSCAQLVKPSGHLFLSTIARTPLAYLITIFAAEDVMQRVSKGTHTYSKYVNPGELEGFFRTYRSPAPSGAPGRPWIASPRRPARTEAETRGMVYVPWNGEWVLAPRETTWAEGCNYLFWVRRPLE
ncbi:uncharacterized protein PHACADRAFT_104382 [Phanerochaete carnosa HHB-10118-sp]|uniref:Ubiquinone biosynthesis O-methyltransferase, mitochondrial n=1 Tax=Phanerochaete carnosa (strain HHB-10118-sp) TaxID=650164 RepID=K5ULC3_PHACS|nr:uncharacterized protein PHACADRAFT_104382 [Phanerochaete carnosa HHB-10118-sp]EKM50451.1 hypothetical protein PHACADRAFT_104382 [Phanerochaete carnosa HHB-10118-sp]